MTAMVDIRFHTSAGPIALEALLATLPDPRPQIAGAGGIVISGADELDLADAGHLALAASREYGEALRQTHAGVVVVHEKLADLVPAGTVAIPSARPHELFVDLLERLYPLGTRGVVTGMLDPTGAAPLLEDGVRLGQNVVLANGVEIGRNSVVGANSVIGRGVTIGRNVVIGANVSIECAYIGNNVVIHPGARIGTEGFGWLEHGRKNRKIPQLGRAIVQDGVEIGANSTIDRGALGDTVIGEGSKIDNLVQIGHNCQIGRYCLIAAHCGLAGSTVLEDSVLMGGRASTAGHLRIGTGAMVLAGSGVARDVAAGARVGGSPAQDARQWWKEVALLRRMTKGDESGR
jgi:UDP-3-O-[3-hydroxymyristoyl] glucosamine N-acyltransferase